jgi:hypothetical protein
MGVPTTQEKTMHMHTNPPSQIIPATGFAALYRIASDEDRLTEIPLICWALTENGVAGVVAKKQGAAMYYAHEVPGFVGYQPR